VTVRGGRVSVVRGASLLLVAATAGGCFPTPRTAEGRDILDLYNGFMVVAAVVAAVVVGLTTFALIRFRSRDDGRRPRQFRGDLRLELLWTAIPAVTVVALFIATFAVLVRVDRTTATPAADIRVSAYRWGWSFEYPADGVSISGIGQPGPEIVVPVREPIRMTLTSADVVHAFYVPQFLFKQDVNPGRESVFEITVEEVGAYGGQCAEFCGLYHARMPFTVRAVERPEYEAWLAANRGPTSGSPSGSIAGGPSSPSDASGAP
jgi:cytochrome c oxidase subunit 2